jgi:CheY-like chemotaxis protein
VTQPTGRKVLIVDDSRDNADTLAALIRSLGHQTWVAYAGMDGLRIARKELPDVIVHDISMPIRSGYSIGRELRAERKFDATVLIAHTGYATPFDVIRARAAGFDIHLPKPTNMRALRDALNAARGESANKAMGWAPFPIVSSSRDLPAQFGPLILQLREQLLLRLLAQR